MAPRWVTTFTRTAITINTWACGVKRAWQREVREKGEQLKLIDVLDSCIRESTLAIGERWPAEPKRRLTAVQRKGVA
jgi:hypothetical protein